MILKIKSKKRVHNVLIDDEDFIKIKDHTWYINFSDKTYAYSYIKGKRVLMHRFIMGVTDPEVKVKHIDVNGLNNQKSNIHIKNKLYEKEPIVSVPSCHGSGERCLMPQLHG